MTGTWDLLILDPILLVLGIVGLSFIVVRERTSLKWVTFFTSTLLFWFATAIVVKINVFQLNQALDLALFSNPLWMVLLFLGSATLFSIFLKPVATWLTGKIHWRKWWLLLALVAMSLTFGLTIINQSVNSAALFIIIAISLGVGLSSNSIYFLMFNEQFYYRIAPVLSTVLISLVISFATFSGTYFVDLESKFFAIGTYNYQTMCYVLAMIGLVVYGVMLAFFQNEDKTYVKSFELSQIKQLPKYTTKRLIYMIVAMFLFGAFFGLTQSSLTTDYLTSLFFAKTSISLEDTGSFVRTFNQFYIVPQFLLGYWLYKQVAFKFGYKPILIGLLSLSLLAILFISFLDNPYLYFILNFILGLTFSQVFYAFFSMAMMWNYRTKNVPVTGYVAGAVLIGPFLIETIIHIFKINETGIYSSFADPYTFNDVANPVVIILYGIAGAFCIVTIVAFFFSFNYVFADYTSLASASQNAKTMLREQQRDKSRSRIFVNDVKIKE